MAIKTVINDGIEYRLSYELLNSKHSDIILFLHGWGANKELMKRAFGEYFKNFCHIYLDFPGFGGSSIINPLSSCEVKSIVEKFLKALEKEPKIVVGHSFGGKIAALLNPKHLILLSSSGIVLPKKLWTKIKIKTFKIFKFLGLGHFYRFFATKDVRGMKPVMYEMLKKVVNEDMSGIFKSYDGEAFIFWGEEDYTTPLICALEIKELIRNSTLFILEGNHFFFLDKGEMIEKKFNKKA